MSRKKEISQLALHKLQDRKAFELGYIDLNRVLRPRNVSLILDLKTAEKWRSQISLEINQKVMRLYDEMVSDYQLRDLNDEVNKLFKERRAWEYRIRELGGPNYTKLSSIGKDEYTINNYRYFGRARELPEVKELMGKAKKPVAEKSEESGEAEFFKSGVYEVELGLDYYTIEPHDFTNLSKIIAESIDKNSLADYKDVDEEFYQNLVSMDQGQKQVEQFLVERKKKKMLESLGL